MAAIDWDASNTALASGGLASCRVSGQDLIAGFEAAMGTALPLASRTRALAMNRGYGRLDLCRRHQHRRQL
jgi:hypothetical protein